MPAWIRLLLVVTLVVATSVVSACRAVADVSSGWLHTSGSTIQTADGRPYVIKAVSWFGMETPGCAPHGLWQISLDDGLAQIASFGFTTIRLPFSNECLHQETTTGINAQVNPELVGLSPLQLMDRVIARARAHGLSVILDRHRPTSDAQSPLWYTDRVSEADWISDWQLLARRYASDPTVIGVDLHNEPHGDACWGCGDPGRDWAAAATRAGNAVLAENPRLLVIVEGVEHNGNGSSTWWGGGLSDVREHPITLTVPHRVVYSPHDYPPSISPQPWFSAPDYPQNLPAQWDKSWGYLVEDGIAPVLLGEFGTRLQTAADQQWLTTLVSYLRTHDISFAYWSFNPNSGDTGGLVLDDWRTPDQAKLNALGPLLTPRRVPTTAATPMPSPTPTPSPVPSSPVPSSPIPSSSAPTPANPTPSPTPAPQTGSPGPDDLAAQWRVTSAWSGGYVAEITLDSAHGRDGWTLAYADPDALSVISSWGMTCQVQSGRVSCAGADWAAQVPANGQRVVGIQVATRGDPPHDPRLDLG